MRRRAALVLAVALAAGTLAGVVGPAHATAQVQVRSNFYDPSTVTVRPGDTVTWAFVDGGHSVTSVAWDGSQRFDSQVRSTGETFSHTYTAEGVWSYYCKLHGSDGSGMWGQIIVDDAVAPAPTSSQPSTTTTTLDPADVVEVPEEQPTLRAALDVAPPGGTISLAAGSYVGAVRVTVPGVTIQGRGASPADVVVEGWDGTKTRGQVGIDVVAGGVAIRNLTVARFGSTGIRFHAVDRFAATDVIVASNPAFGVLADQSRRGQLRSLAVSGSEVGLEVRRCGECDTVVDGVAVDGGGAGVGVRVTDAGSVVVSRSSITSVATGVVLRSADLRSGAPQRGAHVVDNDIDNALSTAIHVDGGWHDVVEGNRVSSAGRAIAVTGVPLPSHDVRVIGNVVLAGDPGLFWDGAGIDVCFGGNTDASGGVPPTQPPMLQTLAAC